MANALFPHYKQSILNGDSNSALSGSGTTGLYAALIDTADYTYSSSHQFYSDVASAAIVGTDQEVTSVTLTNGLISGGNCVFPAVTGDTVSAVILYRKNTGASTTWRLVAYLDTGFTGLPVTPNGGDIDLNWNASGIIQL